MRKTARDEFITIDIDVAIHAEATQVVDAAHMVVMDMRDEHAIHSVSTNAAQRSRLSRGSLLRHTSQLHPKTGTPLDVPVPNNVIFNFLPIKYYF